MTEEQKEALIKWLFAQAYSGNPIDNKYWLDYSEMVKYLPAAIDKILKDGQP